MGNLTIGKSFFAKERDSAYADWKSAVFRELIQNSRDAGATLIQFTIYEEDGSTVITCKDNGRGMTRNILEEIYFNLGNSSKDMSSDIGGFGRARILVPLSFDSYTLSSKDYIVNGTGSSFTVEQSKMIDGFEITCRTREATGAVLLEKCRKFISECNLPNVKITLNNVVMTQFSSNMTALVDLSVNGVDFARVFVVDKMCEPGKVQLRCQGLKMFSPWTQMSRGHLIIELNSSKFMSSSRDSLTQECQYVLSAYLRTLAEDNITGLNSSVNETRLFKGKGALIHQGPKKNAPLVMKEKGQPGKRLATQVVEWLEEEEITKGQVFAAAEYIPDVPIVIQDGDTKAVKISESYDPKNWKFQVKGGKPVWQNCCAELHLLLAWQEALLGAVKMLPALGVSSDIYYSPGFIFSTQLVACCQVKDDIIWLLINPVTNEGKKRYDLRKRAHVQRLCAVAMHEVAHIFSRTHNEKYAEALTSIMSVYQLENVMKNILMIKF